MSELTNEENFRTEKSFAYFGYRYNIQIHMRIMQEHAAAHWLAL